jgi:protein required for attachment to host cells
MKRTCLVVADASRARIFTYNQHLETDGPHDELREEADLVDSARRKRKSELFSEASGASHSGARGYSFDDHRQGNLDHLDREFAKQIATEVDRVALAHDLTKLVLVASTRMLGELRDALAPLANRLTITELERDYSKLQPAALRDRLAEHDILPPRPRRGLEAR